MKDVQCYELFGGIALKNHAFSFHFSYVDKLYVDKHLSGVSSFDYWHLKGEVLFSP